MPVNAFLIFLYRGMEGNGFRVVYMKGWRIVDKRNRGKSGI